MASNLSRDACNHPALKLNNDSTVPKACQIQSFADKLYDTCDCEHFIVLESLHCQIQCWAHKWNSTAFQGIKVSEHAWLATHSLEHYSSGSKWRAPDHNSNRVDMRYKYSLHVLSIKHQQNCTGLKKPVIITQTSVCVCVCVLVRKCIHPTSVTNITGFAFSSVHFQHFQNWCFGYWSKSMKFQEQVKIKWKYLFIATSFSITLSYLW